MPYIEENRRYLFDEHIKILNSALVLNNSKKGDLNYCMSKLIDMWVKNKGISYDTLSDITGVLNDIKTEFERKVVAPYEDEKIKQNGGLYRGIDGYK